MTQNDQTFLGAYLVGRGGGGGGVSQKQSCDAYLSDTYSIDVGPEIALDGPKVSL